MTPITDFSREQLTDLDKETLIALILEQREQIARLVAQVQQLEDRLAKNSRNSSQPPSSITKGAVRPIFTKLAPLVRLECA